MQRGAMASWTATINISNAVPGVDAVSALGIMLPPDSPAQRGIIGVLSGWRRWSASHPVRFLEGAEAPDILPEKMQRTARDLGSDSLQRITHELLSRCEELDAEWMFPLSKAAQSAQPSGRDDSTSVVILLGMPGSGVIDIASMIITCAPMR